MRQSKQQGLHGFLLIVFVWVALFGVAMYFWGLWGEHQINPNQEIAGLVLADGTREVVLKRNRGNQFVGTGFINGVEVPFLVDTGATQVVVPQQIAQRAKLKPGAIAEAETANGVVQVRLTQINELQVGNIILKNVRANISDTFDTDYILLGMSALGQLEVIQRQGELTLRLPLN